MHANDLPAKPLYLEKAMSIAVFLGGPLPVAYIMASNFSALGETEKVLPTWGITLAFTVVYVSLLLSVPVLQEVPQVLFPLTIMILAGFAYRKWQLPQINRSIDRGAKVFSNWRGAGVGLGFLLLNLVIYLAFVGL